MAITAAPVAEQAVDYPEITHLDRASVILRIRLALRKRSGKDWGVVGGRGTGYGWIQIAAPPARRTGPFGSMVEADRLELGELLGLGGVVGADGVSVPDSHDYYIEHIDRAEGRRPRKAAQPYWD